MPLLLVIIYLAFISLGLPDSVLGVAWPALRLDLGQPLEAAGIIAMVVTCGTALSCFLSGHVIKRLGTGPVTFASCLMTGLALLGYAMAPSFGWLLVLAIPLGLGAGAVDTGLNDYVARHFAAKHMSWLHCFWGIGASLGPMIMTWSITHWGSWRLGYQNIATTQLILAAVLFLTLRLWRDHAARPTPPTARESDEKAPPKHTPEHAPEHTGGLAALRITGVPYGILLFFLYAGIEYSIGLWGSSFLIAVRGIALEEAGMAVALYYAGITGGRFLSGFIVAYLNNRQMIRYGIFLAAGGIGLVILPFIPLPVQIAGLFIAGMGLAPIFPCMVHETPRRFGTKASGVVIGYQMGFSYIGVAVFPLLIGIIAAATTLYAMPVFILILLGLMLVFLGILNRMS